MSYHVLIQAIHLTPVGHDQHLLHFSFFLSTLVVVRSDSVVRYYRM